MYLYLVSHYPIMPIKTFRLNLVLNYMANPNNFQSPIQNIIRQMAWLYRFDYAIANGNQIFDDATGTVCNLIYLRSTELTHISSKNFEKLVSDMFSQASLYWCVDVFFKLKKNLKQYPFPTGYIRPLNFPYSDVYNNGNKTLYIDPQALQELDANHVN